MSSQMLSARQRVAILAAIVFALTAAMGWFFVAVPRSHSLGAAGGAVVVDAAADLRLEHSAALTETVAPPAVVPAGAVSHHPGRLIIRSSGVHAPVMGVGV